MTVALSDTGILLRADTNRVLARFFVPGREDLAPGASRAGGVVERVLALGEDQVERALELVLQKAGPHHRCLGEVLRAHASNVISRVDPAVELTDARLLLLGATFTREDSLEGAALCNPSIVPHPDQPHEGATDFVLSVRGIGEGHRSSIGFRTGTVRDDGSVTLHAPGPYPETAVEHAGVHRRSVFLAQFTERENEPENIEFILEGLDDMFDDEQLEDRISLLKADDVSRSNTLATVRDVRSLASSGYRAEFSADSELSERVLWPHSPAESHGLEDARFVRFVEDNGKVTYYATYTAFDGLHIQQHMLDTKDFRTFRSAPMTGAAAVGKGLAMFPRRVHGRFFALTRSDRESNEVASSDDPRHWPDSQSVQIPERSWEMVQLGNCGSPIETDLGWLVLTHGVGPMRTYSLGAILLDLDDPTRMIARTDEPILSPEGDRTGGYVPNVVYTCGSMAHGDTLVLPYGIGDQAIAVATLSISELLRAMRRV
ncbi:MAG: glycoside hydrolase family 130 protein [Actinobacteria bacterium]|nr:glycoside hydrolase family 130 protein [Actinomycetota bacterium]